MRPAVGPMSAVGELVQVWLFGFVANSIGMRVWPAIAGLPQLEVETVVRQAFVVASILVAFDSVFAAALDQPKKFRAGGIFVRPIDSLRRTQQVRLLR